MKPDQSFRKIMALAFPGRRRGFSLIELMVAMTIGLVLLAGLFYVYIGTSQSSRFQGALVLMQNNARFAFELMGVDIRMGGFTGSLDANPVNAVVLAANSTRCPLIDIFSDKGCDNGAGPLVGYANAGPPDVCTTANTSPCYQSDPDNNAATPAPDSLTVVRVDSTTKYSLDPAVALGAGSFTLAAWPAANAPQNSEVFVAADYANVGVFQINAVDVGARTITYVGALEAFPSGPNATALYRLSGVSYYIGRNPVGEPALYRSVLTQAGGAITSVQEELIQGVENMRITYGVDVSANVLARSPLLGDGNVDAYWTVAQVNAGTDGALTMPAATPAAYWSRVLSVRITLTLVSGQNEKVGATGDRLLRNNFTNTIAIRNRL